MTFWTQMSQTEYHHGFIEARGLRTRFLRAGTGDPVVMLHGTSGHLEAFLRNIPVLSEHFDCHAIDMMGHGFTQGPAEDYRIPKYVDHLLAYLDAQGIERAHFVGESLGGWVAARLAVDFPERAGALVLAAPGGSVANPEVMDRIRTSTRKAVESDDISLTRNRLELLMHDPVNVTDELVATRHAIYHQPEFVKQIEHLLCLQKMENRTADLLTVEQAAKIKSPTRIVWGAQNPFGDVPEAQRLNDMIPGSTLEIYGECGHWPQYEHSVRFNREVIDFFRTNNLSS